MMHACSTFILNYFINIHYRKTKNEQFVYSFASSNSTNSGFMCVTDDYAFV